MRLRSTPQPEGGTVTAFMVCMTVALLAVAGLVVDGGTILAARVRAYDDADAAARAGAQALDEAALRQGQVRLDAAAARSAVASFLGRTGSAGTASVTGTRVEVEVAREVHPHLLSAIGIGSTTVHGHGSATAVRGIRRAGD